MFRDLFFVMYGNNLTWTSFCLLFFLIGLVLLIISCIKLKSKSKIFGVILSILFMWQIVPQIFYHLSYFSMLDMPISEAFTTCPCKYKYKKDNTDFIKYMRIAEQTAIIPWQKGAYLCELAKQYGLNYDGEKTLKTYNQAYKYIKSYKYNCWTLALLTYEASGDIDIATKIATEQNLYSVAAGFLIESEDYKTALEFINKAIENRPNNSNLYATRAFINSKLSNNKSEISDYNKAIELAKNAKEKNFAYKYKQIRNDIINNKNNYAIKMGFIKEN